MSDVLRLSTSVKYTASGRTVTALTSINKINLYSLKQHKYLGFLSNVCKHKCKHLKLAVIIANILERKFQID